MKQTKEQKLAKNQADRSILRLERNNPEPKNYTFVISVFNKLVR